MNRTSRHGFIAEAAAMFLSFLIADPFQSVQALDYPYTTAEPQKTGWPLTDEGKAYVLKPEYERRPGSEQNKYLPAMWPVTPSAGNWGGSSWLDTHAKLVEYVRANKGPVDVLLVGDSITQQWGSPLDTGLLNPAWKKCFGGYKTINIGIGGDKTQNVLWRLDHGGVEGLQPRAIVVMIGNNNMFFTPETGIEAAAKGVQMVVANVRKAFPQASVIVAKILPCHAPGVRFYEDIKKTNAALDTLKPDSDPKVHVLDLWGDFTNADGTIKAALFTPDKIHLSLAGYAVYAERLKPLLDKALGENAGAEEIVHFDFETGDLQGWKVVEGNFQSSVGKRPRFNNPPHGPHNREGKFCLSTLEGEPDMSQGSQVGVIESPVIKLAGKKLSFLLAGGNHDDTYAALCDEDGLELLVARGRNSEPLERVTWDVSPYVGHKVFLKVVDLNPGAWGYLECDDFIMPGRIDRDATEKNFAAYDQQKQRLVAEKARIEAQRRQAREKARRERLEDPSLFERSGPHIYAGEHLKAIEFTVGGIGSGCLVLDGAGRTRDWQIFNNFQRATVPESFLAVRARVAGQPAVVRALQTLPAGPFPPMKDLTFRGEYPFAWYSFVDPELPVRVRMEVFNPLIPLDEKNSAIPCAIWKLTAENPSMQAVEVSFLASQQNAVGCIGNQYGGNVNRVRRENGTVVLHMTSRKVQHDPRYGDMALTMLPASSAGRNAAVHGVAVSAGMDELAKQFTEQGTVAGESMAGPTAQGRTIAGALAAPLVVPPGGKATVTVLLTWHFPNAMHGGPAGWTRPGNMYANWWGDALGVLRYVQANLQDLDAKTRLFHDSLYATNLPYWLLDRISSQNAILKSKIYWWSKDGYLGAWEGCCPESGCCEGNATHVGGYVVALPRLFPALGRRMREEAVSCVQPSGAVPVRQSQAHLGLVAFDGLCHEVITCYREHLTSTSAAWLGTQWPKIKRSLDAAIARWDADEDGFLAGHKHGIDVDHSGCDPWLGGLYLCALAAADRMALLNNDAPAAARYGRILAAGKRNQNQRLWNGEYFIQFPDPKPGSDYNDGSYIDALLGQWHACQLDLGWMYAPERVRSAAGALFRYNFRTDFHGVKQVPRKFVADDDPGMQMGAWPRGPVPPNAILYHDEVMSGFEYTAAVAMVQAGLLREGFAVVRAVAHRYDGRLREGLTPGGQASWGFSGNPFGDDECGKYYKRAMSIWSMLLACQGMLYDGPAAQIGFLPLWKGADHCSFFTAAEGWGLFTQNRSGAVQLERIDLRFGRLAVRTLIFAGTEGCHPTQSKVKVAGKPVPSKLFQKNDRVLIQLDDEYHIQASESIEVVLQ